jgi:enhancing lycopene biosynthesis protein 2
MTETTLSECSADATIVPGSRGRGKNISQFTVEHRLSRP